MNDCRPHCANPSRLAALVSVSASAFIATIAYPGFTYNTAPAPGGFIQACAGPATPGSNPPPGTDFTALFTAPGSDVEEQSFAGDNSASATAAYSGVNTNNGASGTVGMGYAQLTANNDSPNAGALAAGMANGGWSETFIVSNPALTGQSGYMQFTLDVSGTLFASGISGGASFSVTGFKDTQQLLANSLFDPGGSDILGTEAQYGYWAIGNYTWKGTSSKTVNDTVTFAVPIVFGTEFKLGIYSAAKAILTASSFGVPGNSAADVDFSEGLTWGGIVNVYHGLTPIGEYTITSGTGIDWGQPVGAPNSPDLNGDGIVDGADMGLLLSAWGTPAGDLNGDGTTDGADFGILLGAWS